MGVHDNPVGRAGGSLLRVSLVGVRFYGRHGLFPQEELAGNDFSLDLDADYHPETYNDIDRLISYADLYALAMEEALRPRSLLEEVADAVATRALDRWPQICRIRVALTKQRPPIAGCDGCARVELIREPDIER